MTSKVHELLQQLNNVAPHIAHLHSLGELDKGLWSSIDSIVKFMDEGTSGNVHIKIYKGTIGEVRSQKTEYSSSSNRRDQFDE